MIEVGQIINNTVAYCCSCCGEFLFSVSILIPEGQESRWNYCPFCGGRAKYEDRIQVIPVYDENGACVDVDDIIYSEQTGCPECNIWFYNEEDDPEGITIEKWNKRVANA